MPKEGKESFFGNLIWRAFTYVIAGLSLLGACALFGASPRFDAVGCLFLVVYVPGILVRSVVVVVSAARLRAGDGYERFYYALRRILRVMAEGIPSFVLVYAILTFPYPKGMPFALRLAADLLLLVGVVSIVAFLVGALLLFLVWKKDHSITLMPEGCELMEESYARGIARWMAFFSALAMALSTVGIVSDFVWRSSVRGFFPASFLVGLILLGIAVIVKKRYPAPLGIWWWGILELVAAAILSAFLMSKTLL